MTRKPAERNVHIWKKKNVRRGKEQTEPN